MPIRSIARLLNVATPFDAVALVVPLRTAPEVPVPSVIVIVMDVESSSTTFPLEFLMATFIDLGNVKVSFVATG